MGFVPYRSHESRGAEVILLDCVIRSDGEESCAGSIICQCADTVNGRHGLVCDMFGANVPSPCFATSIRAIRQVGEN